MKFIRKHKTLCIVGIIILILVILLAILFKAFSIDYSVDEYGNRLDGIEKVEVSSSDIKKLKTDLNKIEGVDDVIYLLKGRLVYIEIEFDDITIDAAKEIAEKSLDYFSDKQKKFYDFQFILTSKKEADGYPELGYKHKSSDSIVW